MKMGRATHSSSSSIDSSNHPPPASSFSLCLPIIQTESCNSTTTARLDLSTDLRLGLSISPNDFTQRERPLNWPPIKSILRNGNGHHPAGSLFIKIYMEGIPIGRKLNLLAQDGYEGLIRTISHMFRTTILCAEAGRVHSDKHHVLTYEDKEGDWMMVGDVPWEMFLTNVRKLKITRADRC